MSGPDVNGGAAEKTEEEAPKHINIKVKDQQENEVFFKIKRTTPMEKLMNAYCQQKGMTFDSVRFMFDGVRVVKEDTPSSLEMDEGDMIEVFQQQLGGCKLI
jgi:hypothetical protein